jgi:hypothetical protein
LRPSALLSAEVKCAGGEHARRSRSGKIEFESAASRKGKEKNKPPGPSWRDEGALGKTNV